MVTYGTVTGTNTGYIYVWGWINNAQQDFLNAVQALWQTNGLIIDFRFNIGGNMFYSNPGLSLLFDSAKTTIDFGVRCSPNHLEMCPGNNPGPYTIYGTPPGYNKPIAVLVGPGAVSSGDQVALRFKYHPRARFFGKSTSTAFNVPQDVNLNADWLFRFVIADAFKVSNPGNYLTHQEFPVDQNIWLTREKVVQGRDDVVEAALDWIIKSTGISGTGEEIPQNISLRQNYPNPFNPVTKIKFSLAKTEFVSVKVYDALGREITALVNDIQKPGIYEIEWNASNYASGIYYLKLNTPGFSDTKKMILLK
jgi:C-terminal processing protease CtpA/Prc